MKKYRVMMNRQCGRHKDGTPKYEKLIVGDFSDRRTAEWVAYPETVLEHKWVEEVEV